MLDPFNGKLEQTLTENYVQRCFTRWDEIGSLLAAKRDPVFSAKMVFYRLFTSFKYRLHLQRSLVGFSNRPPREDRRAESPSAPALRGLFGLLDNALNGERKSGMPSKYLDRMLGMLEAEGIDMHALPPPSTRQAARTVTRGLKKMESWAKPAGNLTLHADLYNILPPDSFRDGTHLNREGLIAWRRHIRPAMDALLEEGRLRQFELNDERTWSTNEIYYRQAKGSPKIILEDGFYGLEGTGYDAFTWTGGQASLLVPVEDGASSYRLTIQARDGHPTERRTLEVSCGRNRRAIRLSEERKAHGVLMKDCESGGDGWLRVEFSLEEFVPGDVGLGGDPRGLGFMLYGAGWEPVTES
jgi:hypothetical protein